LRKLNLVGRSNWTNFSKDMLAQLLAQFVGRNARFPPRIAPS
jgi:hypothetical protein